MVGSILVVDDDTPIRDLLEISLQMTGCAVRAAGSGEEALELIHRERFDLIVSDIVLPGMSGLQVLQRARAVDPTVLVVLVTGYATVETAVEALRYGAEDYVVKPFEVDTLRRRIRQLLRGRGARGDEPGAAGAGGGGPAPRLVGASRAMEIVRAHIAKAAAIDSTVLLTGESGTGKELVARAIHDASGRRLHRFVPVNCAAIPETLFESQLFGHVRGAFTSAVRSSPGLFAAADRGTLFLDEVAELPLHLQVKLLRVLEERQIWAVGATHPARFDVRIIAATNRDLRSDVAAGRFREDLFYRLNVVRIVMPPLRDHREDIPLLVAHMIPPLNERLDRRFAGIEPSALDSLLAHEWRGNVRELQHVLERAMTVGDGPLITRDLLSEKPGPPPAPESLKEAMRQFERQKIREALACSGFDKREAARRLGLSLASLYRKLA